MNCPLCNAQINENDTYCKTCGAAFTSKQLAFSTVKENPITKPISAWKFFWLILLSLVPVVNVIAFICLSFKPMSNLNIKAFSRASIAYSLIYTEAVVFAIWCVLSR